MPVLIVGYVLAALLPIIGFARLLWRAQADLDTARERSQRSGGPALSWDEFDDAFADRESEPRSRRNAVIWDIIFVGTGLIIGAATSIAALPGMLLG